MLEFQALLICYIDVMDEEQPLKDNACYGNMMDINLVSPCLPNTKRLRRACSPLERSIVASTMHVFKCFE